MEPSSGESLSGLDCTSLFCARHGPLCAECGGEGVGDAMARARQPKTHIFFVVWLWTVHISLPSLSLHLSPFDNLMSPII